MASIVGPARLVRMEQGCRGEGRHQRRGHRGEGFPGCLAKGVDAADADRHPGHLPHDPGGLPAAQAEPSTRHGDGCLHPGTERSGGNPGGQGCPGPCPTRRARKPVQAVFGDARMDHRQLGHLVRHEVRRSRCLWQVGQACLARLALHGPVIGHHVDPSGWRHGPLVGDVTGLATASPATGPGWRVLGRARQAGRRRPGRVPRMLPHPGFEIPDAFLQTGVHRPEVNVHRPEVNVRRPQLSNGCLQGGYHGWHHSTECAAKPTRHPTPP